MNKLRAGQTLGLAAALLMTAVSYGVSHPIAIHADVAGETCTVTDASPAPWVNGPGATIVITGSGFSHLQDNTSAYMGTQAGVPAGNKLVSVMDNTAGSFDSNRVQLSYTYMDDSHISFYWDPNNQQTVSNGGTPSANGWNGDPGTVGVACGDGSSAGFSDATGGFEFTYAPPVAGGSGGSDCTANSATNVSCATVSVGAGSLIRLNAPDVNYAAVNLNGQAQITNANIAYQVRDATGSGNGWNMTLSATTFTDLSNANHTLPSNALTLNAPSGQVCLTPGCTPATSDIVNPVSILTGTGNSYKIVNATANSGMGSVETDTSSSLAIPASAYQGSYQSTWTLSLTSGP